MDLTQLYKQENFQPEFERLYISLQKEISVNDRNVVDIYYLLDNLSGIPRKTEDQVEPSPEATNKIIPKFQEEIWKLREINEVLATIKYHLQDLIGS